jgi:hypothetical protein
MFERYQYKVTGLALLLVLLVPMIGQAQIKLQEGTDVSVAFQQDVSSKYAEPGDEIPIKLLEDIAVGGVVLVKAGATGKALVKSVEPAGKPGTPGKIAIELTQLDPEGYQSVDDKVIKLQAKDGPIEEEGKSKKLLSWLLIFGLFIKGTQAELPADQPIPAVVAEDVFIMPSEG